MYFYTDNELSAFSTVVTGTPALAEYYQLSTIGQYICRLVHLQAFCVFLCSLLDEILQFNSRKANPSIWNTIYGRHKTLSSTLSTLGQNTGGPSPTPEEQKYLANTKKMCESVWHSAPITTTRRHVQKVMVSRCVRRLSISAKV